jgi:hypothetical protein
MNQELWLPWTLPGLNEIIAAAKGSGGKGTAYARMKRQWGKDIALYIRSQGLKPVEAACLRFHWYEKDRRRDPDNIVAARKFILDALVDTNILPKDSQQHIKGFSDAWLVNKRRPGVLVEIEEREP